MLCVLPQTAQTQEVYGMRRGWKDVSFSNLDLVFEPRNLPPLLMAEKLNSKKKPNALLNAIRISEYRMWPYTQCLSTGSRGFSQQFTETVHWAQEILLPTDRNEESHIVSSRQMSTAWCGCLQGVWAKTTYYLYPVINLKTKMHLLLYKVIRNFRSVLHKHQETYDTFSSTGREVLST